MHLEKTSSARFSNKHTYLMTRGAQLICLIICLESCNKKENEKTNTDSLKKSLIMFKKFDMLIWSLVLGPFFKRTNTLRNKLINRKEVGIFLLGMRQCAFWNV